MPEDLGNRNKSPSQKSQNIWTTSEKYFLSYRKKNIGHSDPPPPLPQSE